MHNLIDPSFFLTKNMGAPHGDTFGMINPLSSSSHNCFLSSFNSIVSIWYSALEIGAVPSKNSISKSNTLWGGRFDSSFRKPSSNSFMLLTWSMFCWLSYSNATQARNSWLSLDRCFYTFIAYILHPLIGFPARNCPQIEEGEKDALLLTINFHILLNKPIHTRMTS